MKIQTVFAKVALLSILACGFEQSASAVSAPLIGPDIIRMERVNKGAVRGDASIIPDIGRILDYPSAMPQALVGKGFDPFSQINFVYVETALRAAVRLHAVELLPKIERIIASPNSDASALARVVKARLLADEATQNRASPKQEAAAKIADFYAELGLAPTELNTALHRYATQELDVRGQPVLMTDWVKPTPVGVYALREIANIVYQNGPEGYLSLPSVRALDFKADGGSALKIEFARPTRAERVAALIDHLAQGQPALSLPGMTPEGQESYITQLAVEEGPAAAQSAVDKIQQMEAHPEQYQEHNFYNLIDIVRDAGDEQQGARLDKVHDTRQKIASRLSAAAKSLQSKTETTKPNS